MSSHVTFELIKHGLALARRKQELTRPSYMDTTPGKRDLFFNLGYCRQTEVIPPTRLQKVPGEIVDVQALHDQNDRAFALVIKTRGEGLLIPVDDTPPCDFRCGVVRLYRVVDDNELPTTPGERTADGRSQAEAALCRAHLALCVLSRIDTRF